MTTDPGAPRANELARNAAMHALADLHREYTGPLGDGSTDAERVAKSIADNHTVTWETDINSAGVPVRRYVLRGAWEVDPNPPTGPTKAERLRIEADAGRAHG